MKTISVLLLTAAFLTPAFAQKQKQGVLYDVETTRVKVGVSNID